MVIIAHIDNMIVIKSMMRHGTCVSVCRESSTAAAARSGWQLRCG